MDDNLKQNVAVLPQTQAVPQEMYYFKIVIADLLDFATDPEGENMTILQFAKELKNGKSHFKKIQKIIDETRKYSGNKRKAGAKGGQAKRSSATANSNNAKANASKSYLETEAVTITEYNPPISPQGDNAFDEFWKAYPKKIAKGEARKAWKKIKRPSETKDKILAALKWQKESADWTKENGTYIPNPATYLNGMRWEDEPKKPVNEHRPVNAQPWY